MNKQIRATPQAVLVGPGRCFLQELLHKNMVLLPFSIHLFGRWGPITQTFLTENGTNSTHIFPTYQPNAASMFHRATTTPCPIGILFLWTLLHITNTLNLHHPTTRIGNHKSILAPHLKCNKTIQFHTPGSHTMYH